MSSSSVLWLHLYSWVRSLFIFWLLFWHWYRLHSSLWGFNEVISVIFVVQSWELHVLHVWHQVSIEFTEVYRWVLKLFIFLFLLQLHESLLMWLSSILGSFSLGIFLSLLLLLFLVDLDLFHVFHFLSLSLNKLIPFFWVPVIIVIWGDNIRNIFSIIFMRNVLDHFIIWAIRFRVRIRFTELYLHGIFFSLVFHVHVDFIIIMSFLNFSWCHLIFFVILNFGITIRSEASVFLDQVHSIFSWINFFNASIGHLDESWVTNHIF